MISRRVFLLTIVVLLSSLRLVVLGLSTKNTTPGFLVPYGNFNTNIAVGARVIDVAASTNSHVVVIGADLFVSDTNPYHTPSPGPDFLSMPEGIKAVAVAAAPDHTVALRSDTTTVAWGDTRYGALVNGATNVVGIATAHFHSLILHSDGSVFVVTHVGPSDVPPNLNAAIAVAAGDSQSVALQSNGAVVAWGSGINPNDAISTVPQNVTNVTAIASGNSHAVALKSDGTIVLWGSQTYVPPGATNIVAIAAGGRTTIAKRADNHIFVWGNGNVAFETDKVVYAFAAADDFVVLVQQDWTRQPVNLIATVQGNAVNLSANLNGGYHYQLQATSDFVTWQPVGGLFGAGSVTSPLNQALDNTSNTFYRLIETQ